MHNLSKLVAPLPRKLLEIFDMTVFIALLLLATSLLILAWFFHLATHDSYNDSFKSILMIYGLLLGLQLIFAQLNHFSCFRGLLSHQEFLLYFFGPLFVACVLCFAASFLLLLASLDSSCDDFPCFRTALISFGFAVFLLFFCGLSFFFLW